MFTIGGRHPKEQYISVKYQKFRFKIPLEWVALNSMTNLKRAKSLSLSEQLKQILLFTNNASVIHMCPLMSPVSNPARNSSVLCYLQYLDESSPFLRGALSLSLSLCVCFCASPCVWLVT